MDKLKKLLKNKYVELAIVAFVIILTTIVIACSIISSKRKEQCRTLREEILLSIDKYVENNSLLPTLNGTSIVVNLSSIDDEFTFGKKTITGNVTYTKYNDEYIKTVEIANADYCSTNKFGKETDKYNSKYNVKVNVYFNYYTVESYNSKYTNYLPSEKISTEETNGVLLPIDAKDLPTIPSNAVVTEYVREVKTYYSYRDKKWKWYKNNIEYSDYSSTQPVGYTNKDTATLTYTEATDWSLNYPEEFEYRHIKTKTGYQWYYMDGKNKVYWENGAYSTESPGKEYKKDTSTEAKMYSYYDKIWRWYNGDNKRVYSYASSVKPTGYNYKDETTLTYTNWSKFTDTSSLTSLNEEYREEITDLYSRYLIKYDVYSYAMFEKPVKLEELEEKLGKSYQEIVNDNSIKVDVIFKFQNEAK